MHNPFGHKFWAEYTDAEWTLLKVSLALLWIDIVHHVALNADAVLYPAGLCSLFNCSFLLHENLPFISLIAALILSVFYVAEKWMTVTTFLLFLLSLLLFTLEESNGILMRCGLYTMVFFAQFIAYWRKSPQLKTERVQMAIQIVAAGYVLAGISKLRESGLGWADNAPQASIQMVKSYCGYYVDSGELQQLQTGLQLSIFALKHALVVKILFGASLLLELFAWVSLKNKKYAFIYGLLLLSMHLGIIYFMHILIVAVFYPMLVLMVNPLFLLYASGSAIFKKIKGQ